MSNMSNYCKLPSCIIPHFHRPKALFSYFSPAGLMVSFQKGTTYFMHHCVFIISSSLLIVHLTCSFKAWVPSSIAVFEQLLILR